MKLFAKYKILTMYFILFILFQITLSRVLQSNPPPIKHIIKTNSINKQVRPQAETKTSIREQAIRSVKNEIFYQGPQVVQQANSSTILKATLAKEQPKKNQKQSLNYVIPSSKNQVVPLHKIYELADVGDIRGIEQAVQSRSSLWAQKCHGKIDYLAQIAKIVNSTKRTKQIELKNVQNKIYFAENQVKQIKNRIKELQIQRKNLSLYSKNFSISLILDNIQFADKETIKINQQIQNKTLQIKKKQKQIQDITLVIQNQNQKLQINKKNLTLTDNYIYQLQSRIKMVRQQRLQIQRNISKRELSMKERNQVYKWKAWLISYVNSSIPVLQKYLHKYQQQSFTLEVDLQRTRSQLSKAKNRDKQMLQEIYSFQQRLSNSNKKLFFSQRLQQIKNLTLKLKNIQSFVQKYTGNMTNNCKGYLNLTSPNFYKPNPYPFCLYSKSGQIRMGQILQILGDYIFRVERDDQVIVFLKPDVLCFQKYEVDYSPRVGQWVLWKGALLDQAKQEYNMNYLLIV